MTTNTQNSALLALVDEEIARHKARLDRISADIQALIVEQKQRREKIQRLTDERARYLETVDFTVHSNN